MENICKNCRENINGKYCSNCGQSGHVEDINFGYLVHEFQHSILHLDKGISYTAKELFRRPGHSIREFLEGKRVKHFKPIGYIFVLSTIYSLMIYFSNENNFFDSLLEGFNNGATASKTANNTIKLTNWITWLRDHYAVSMLLLIPVFTLSTYIAFYRRGYNFVQHFVLNAYIYGQCTIIYMLILFLELVAKNEIWDDFCAIAKLLAAFTFTNVAYIQFFNKDSKIKTILLAILSHIIYAILLIIILFTVTLVSGV